MDTTNEKQMKERLIGASKLAEEAKVQRRQRAVKGSHLLAKLVEMAQASGAAMKDNSGFHKFTGPTKGKAVLVAIKGGRVDLSGFTVDAPGVRQISEESAREKHLGKVRGQIAFDKTDEEVIKAYESALAVLMTASASEPAPTPAA